MVGFPSFRIDDRIPGELFLIEETRPFSFSMPYGELEKMLSRLLEATPEAVRSRFRKLRSRAFPDGLQTGSTGVRVRYDLPHLLAVTAVFELNNAYIAQGHAAAIVQGTWPEWCRALIAAAWELDIIQAPEDIPAGAGPIVVIACAAVAAGEDLLVDSAAVSGVDNSALALSPSLAIDVRRFARAIIGWAQEAGGNRFDALVEDLATFERAFGWARPIVNNGDFEAMPRGDSFLNEGPFFERALALLQAPRDHFEQQAHPAARMRLQWLFAYLESPAPVDAYKNELGHAADQPRLKHYLHFYARSMSLASGVRYPEIFNEPEPKVRALELVRGAIEQRKPFE